jgi:hypothetical protein
MRILHRKWLSNGLLIFAVLALALSFTAAVQADGKNQPAPPARGGPPHGKPPAGGAPMGKSLGPMAPVIPASANCIGVFAWYDGNLNGIVDANEDLMDGASVVLMTALPAPSPDPPIGADGKPVAIPEAPMGPAGGPPMPMAKGPTGPPDGAPKPLAKGPMGPAQGPSRPMNERPMGPPHGGPTPPKHMANQGYAKFQVHDRQITRDGGTAIFCDLAPGEYILQGDAVDEITYGDNRQYTRLEEGGFATVGFGFSYLNGKPEATNGHGP